MLLVSKTQALDEPHTSDTRAIGRYRSFAEDRTGQDPSVGDALSELDDLEDKVLPMFTIVKELEGHDVPALVVHLDQDRLWLTTHDLAHFVE